MGFHEVATGILVKKHGDFSDYLSIVYKSITHKKTGKKYVGKKMKKIVSELIEKNQKLEHCYDILDFEHDFELELHDDIFVKDSQFYYKNDLNIYICVSFCSVMIAISVVGDDLGGKYKTFKFKDETILNLLEWKTQLVNQGRLENTCQFATVPNCCS